MRLKNISNINNLVNVNHDQYVHVLLFMQCDIWCTGILRLYLIYLLITQNPIADLTIVLINKWYFSSSFYRIVLITENLDRRALK